MRKFLYIPAMGFLLLLGCMASSPPRPTISEYFVTEGAGFLIEKSIIKYGMNYRLTKDYPGALFVVVEFENPKPGGAVLISEATLEANEKELSIKSPDLAGIQNNRKYMTILKAYKDREKTIQVAEHKQQIMFRIPTDILRQRGVVIF